MINEVLNLKQGSIVSIIGAGGKTSLMFALAQSLRNQYKILVTTSTKIFIPNDDQYDMMIDDLQDIPLLEKGTVVFGKKIEGTKLSGIQEEELSKIKDQFDLILIEADGSKQKPIKGWNLNEPVVYQQTTHTIGVLSASVLKKPIHEQYVHRMNEFLELTDTLQDDLISVDHLCNVVFHPSGLFKNAVGKRVLLINQVDTNEQMRDVQNLINQLIIQNHIEKIIDQLVIGSIINNNYQEVIQSMGR